MPLLQAIRGMADILPADTAVWRYLERTVSDILGDYGYREIRTPVVEKTALFERSIGEVTDIVEKEMYTFKDRNGDSLTLRPEGTASCVRSILQQGLVNEGVQRLWYIGPMFRRERPQQGRYRQFHQIGAEVFGLRGPDIDAEMIMMTARFWQKLGVKDVRLHLNSLGNSASRAHYRETLVDYLRQHYDRLDDDSKRRLESNPLRVLDSKNPEVRKVVAGAPLLSSYLDDDSREHFNGLCERLDAVGVAYTLDETLVRGLDYYSDTVFEWITDNLGAQGTICAGGRYDGLVRQLGGKPSPAIGFAIGIERLIEMLPGSHDTDEVPDVYMVGAGDSVQVSMLALSESLRNEVDGLRIMVHCGGGSLKSQFKKADKSGAQLVVIVGEQELEEGMVSVKFLRNQQLEQERIAQSRLAKRLADQFNL